MFPLGETRCAAELVLPIATFVLVLSTVRAVALLYPESRWTPYATAAFLCVFPAALSQSRIYLFEWPFAASVAATCWAMLATDRFTNFPRSLVFGIAAGITALVRAGGPALLTGPCLVYAAVALREAPRGRKALNLGIAAAAGVAVAATWYLPNLTTFLEYIHQVTYGDQASLFAGGSSAFSWDNALYTFQWYWVDGAGIPAAALMLAAYATACAMERRWILSARMGALFVAFAIVFVAVIAVAQRAGGVLLLAIMGIQSLAVVRAVAIVPRPAARGGFALAAALLAIHHLYAMTFGFAVGRDRSEGTGPFPTFPLWNHRNLYVGVAGPARQEKALGEWMSQIVDRIEALPVAKETIDRPVQVCFNADNPIFQLHTLRIEATLRHHNWHGIQLFWLPLEAARKRQAELQERVLLMDVLVNRTTKPPSEYDKVVAIITGPLVEGASRRFTQVGEPVRFPNGDEYTIYQRIPDSSSPSKPR